MSPHDSILRGNARSHPANPFLVADMAQDRLRYYSDGVHRSSKMDASASGLGIGRAPAASHDSPTRLNLGVC